MVYFLTETLIQEDLNQGSDQDRPFPKKVYVAEAKKAS
jgi:hypothetical protein